MGGDGDRSTPGGVSVTTARIRESGLPPRRVGFAEDVGGKGGRGGRGVGCESIKKKTSLDRLVSVQSPCRSSASYVQLPHTAVRYIRSIRWYFRVGFYVKLGQEKKIKKRRFGWIIINS